MSASDDHTARIRRSFIPRRSVSPANIIGMAVAVLLIVSVTVGNLNPIKSAQASSLVSLKITALGQSGHSSHVGITISKAGKIIGKGYTPVIFNGIPGQL